MEDRNKGSRYKEDDDGGTGRRYEDDEEPRKPMNNKQPLMIVAVSVVLSILVVMMWANTSLLTKEDYGTNIDSVLADMGKMQTSLNTVQDGVKTVSNLNTQVSQVADKINALTKEVASIKSSLDKYAKTDSLTQTNTNLTNIQNTLNALQSKVNNIQVSDTSGLSTSIETLKTQLASISSRILVLEQGGTSEVSPSKAIQVSVKTLGNNALSPIDTKKADNTAGVDGIYDGLRGAMRVTLTNTSLVDVDDAIVNLEFNIAPSIPTSFTPSVSGGGVPWHKEYNDSQFIEFYNGAWGLSVPAGQTVTLTLTLTIQGTNSSAWNISGGYYYQLRASAS